MWIYPTYNRMSLLISQPLLRYQPLPLKHTPLKLQRKHAVSVLTNTTGENKRAKHRVYLRPLIVRPQPFTIGLRLQNRRKLRHFQILSHHLKKRVVNKFLKYRRNFPFTINFMTNVVLQSYKLFCRKSTNCSLKFHRITRKIAAQCLKECIEGRLLNNNMMAKR